MRRLRDCLILAVTCLTFAASNVCAQYTVARIQCPTEAKAKVKWLDRIGTYSREKPPDEWITFEFRKMDQAEQKITCRYEFTNGTASMWKNYEYTAKRKISTCKRVDARTIDCFLE